MRLKICDSHLTCKVANKCLNVHERVEAVERNKMVPSLLLLSCELPVSVKENPDRKKKERYENHKTSFRHRSHLTAPDLSNYYWKLVDKGAVPTIKFSIAKRVKGNTFINNCNLCLSEKAFIIRNLDDENMLNKMSEFISKCRHINKRLLNRVKDDSND